MIIEKRTQSNKSQTLNIIWLKIWKKMNYYQQRSCFQQNISKSHNMKGTVIYSNLLLKANSIQQLSTMGQEESKGYENALAANQTNTSSTDKGIAELIAKNQKLCCKKKRFQTDDEPFDKFYQQWDGTQNEMHIKPMQRYIDLITKKYNETKKPISVLDVGCGYGKQAFNMKKKLQANGVIIQKYYGYDISAPLIQIANQKYAKEPNIKFFKKNLDTQFDDVEQFDAVVSFCALHWVNDIHSVGESIARSLKSKGLFMGIIGLQAREFHELRVRFINTSKWTQSFDEQHRHVSHFYFEKDIYLETFGKYFENKSDYVRVTPYRLTHQQCIDFLGNWIQEVRHLIRDIKDEPRKEAIVRAYTSDLIESFPLGMTKNVVKHQDGCVTYDQHLLEYEGIKND